MPLPALYRGLTTTAEPAVHLYLRRRQRRGREDADRLSERWGVPSAERPPGALVWLHAASVGEATSILPLIERLSGWAILVTTGTVASARLLASRLPPHARHQYVPVDVPAAVARFLDHWRPDLALWVESEFWPNLVLTAATRGIPLVLLNGRLSAASLARWQRLPGLIGPVLRAFALCLAQDAAQAERLRGLGAGRVATPGDLKMAAAPLAVDLGELARLQAGIGSRPMWLAASTHDGEEAIAAAVHNRLAAAHPQLLTIIAPRHPARAEAVAAMMSARGLACARRSRGQLPSDAVPVYLVDTLGELGLFYRLADIAFVGGSLVAAGGHNLFEAARLDCAILHGPDVASCAAMAEALAAAGAAETIADAAALADSVGRLLDDPAARAARAVAARRVAAAGDGVLDRVLELLAPWLDPLMPAVPLAQPA